MNLFQYNQFIHPRRRHTHHKIQTRIPPIHKLVISLFQNITQFRCSREDICHNIPENTAFFGFRVGGIKKFREPDFALPGHQDDETPTASSAVLVFDGFAREICGHDDDDVLLLLLLLLFGTK